MVPNIYQRTPHPRRLARKNPRTILNFSSILRVITSRSVGMLSMKTTNVREEEEAAVVAVEQDTVTPESTKEADQGALRIGLNNKFILLKFDRYFLKFLLIFFYVWLFIVLLSDGNFPLALFILVNYSKCF